MKTAIVLLTSAVLLCAGCRAPGTYVSINRPFKEVREGIRLYASLASHAETISELDAARLLPAGKVECVQTSEVSEQKFKIILADRRLLQSIGPDWTEIEARNSRQGFSQVRFYCTTGPFRNRQHEAQTLVRLCNYMGYVP